VTPAEQLVALAHEELGLVSSGRADQLKDLQDRRDAALASLDAHEMTGADRTALVQAHALQVQITALLEKATTEAAGQLARLERGRAGVRGYASTTKRA
jgi:hypothetical protein